MMKRSAGVLNYRIRENQIEVLLCHMGGPYWSGIDAGAWSIPKGEMKEEKAIDTAVREFEEETGFSISRESLQFLGSRKQPSRKLVIVFTSSNDYDASKSYSNTFKKEWSKGSGIYMEFPEMDKAEWMSLSEAKAKILKGQVYFLMKLEQNLKSQLGICL